MASEKELFVTKQYVPVGPPISQNERTIIYKVKCFAEPGAPEGVLKMYRKRNIYNLYTKLYQLDYSEWPHIYSVKYFDDSTLVVEEFLTGNTLAELLEKNREKGVTFTEEEAYEIIHQLSDCIQQLMKPQPPIIHHDLKPSNIFITEVKTVKLLDFVPGTTKHQNPMQHIIRILGKLFHQMLTGREPKNKKCTYDGRYESIIRKCMEKNPEKQYNNITEFQDDLEYAKNHPPKKSFFKSAMIPYTLTFPFQGTILTFEWLLMCFFWYRDNMTTLSLFTTFFALHSLVFAIRRHAYLKEHNVQLSAIRKTTPIIALVIILLLLFYGISFIL